jgi:NADH-quinone oxidoreductase subunit J
MTATAFAFYIFAVTTLTGGLMTVVSRNPVHSVLWLILSFLSSAGLFILLGAEFVAMLLVIVYVGAVAVLFLFVVMMLDVDFAELKAEMARYLPLVIMQLTIAFGVWEIDANATTRLAAPMVTINGVPVENTRAIGLILYDRYFLLFQIAGMILLTAMIGAIVLTLRHRVDVKRQDPLAQMFRDPAKAIEMRDLKPGQGLASPIEGVRR